jgi:hypothetical protein
MYSVESLSSFFRFGYPTSPSIKDRCSSVGETSQKGNFIAAMVEGGQTPSDYTLPPSGPKSNLEKLLQKFRDFWNRAREILRQALDFVCDIFLKNKLHKLGGFSWNVVKIESIFSFTWQQSPSSTTTPLHINGTYVEHQTIIFQGSPGDISGITTRCTGCGYLRTISNTTPPPQITA